MSKVYQRIPIGQLHGILSDEILKEIDFFYRTKVSPEREYHSESLWADRDTLSMIYHAASINQLHSKKHRKSILRFQPPDELRSIAESAGLDVGPEDTPDDIATRLSRVPWRRSEDGSHLIAKYLGYGPSVIPEKETSREHEWVVHPYGEPHKSLMLYQHQVVEEANDKLQPPNSRTLIQMPTGSGKTRVAMELLSTFLNNRPEATILWLAHVRELCYQAADAFQEVWRHVGRDGVSIRIVEGEWDLPPQVPGPCLIVAGLQKMYSTLKREGTLPEFDLVVIDEAHKAVAPTYEQVIDASLGLNSRLLGLTATPGRALEDDAENRQVANFFYQNIVGLPAGEGGAISWLQDEGYLSKVLHDPVELNQPIELDEDEIEKVAGRGDFSKKFLRKLALNRHRNQTILEKLEHLALEKTQTIVFATSLDQSRILSNTLAAMGYRAAHVDGSTPRAARDYATTQFKEGDIQFLFNYDVFTTGFDAPSTECVVIARPTLSIVLYSQMIGRGLRGPQLGGNDRCRIVDIIDNIETYSDDLDRIYEFFDDYWAEEDGYP